MRAIQVAAFISIMVGVTYGFRWLMTDVELPFGDGVAIGMAIMFFLIWGAWKADPNAFIERRSRPR
jgi:hypothetical protein